ncbi:MAG: hypothetical protein KDE33_16305 [Bacteroidetes bacterium]|nr:hypothetical protein [Bacteroidota bacterium]
MNDFEPNILIPILEDNISLQGKSCTYRFDNPSIRVITEKEESVINNIHLEDDFQFFRIGFPSPYYLSRIALINKVELVNLLIGIDVDSKDTYSHIYEIKSILEFIDLEITAPLKVYTSYPFEVMIEMKIPPLYEVYNRTNFNQYLSTIVLWLTN